MRKPPRNQIDQDFETMIRGFEAIALITSKTRRDFHLSQSARYWNLPRAEARRLFREWLIERNQGGGSNG